MNPSEPFTVNTHQLHLLGALLPGEKSAVSPLMPALEGTQREDVKRSLQGCSVLNAYGEIDEKFRRPLALLSNVTRVISLALFFPDRTVSVSRYFNPRINASITLVERAGELSEIREVISPDELLTGSGFSDNEVNPRIFPLDLRLSREEASMVSALLDEERASVITSLAGSSGNDAPIPAFLHTAQSVLQAMNGSKSGEEDFPIRKMITGLISPVTVMQPSDIAPLFSRLIAKGVVVPSGSGYLLSDTILSLARRLVLTDFVLSVTLRQDDGSGPEITEEAYCMRADGALAWFLARSGAPGTVTLRYMPAGMLKKFADQILTDPNYSLATIESMAISVPTGASQSPAVSPVKKFCPSCGTAIPPGKKFCPECGVQIN